MNRFVLDTNVFIRAIRDPEASRELAAWQRAMAPYLYQHAVVAAELLAGARTPASWTRWHERWVLPAERVRRVLVPTYGAWRRASRIVARLAEAGRLGGGVPAGFFNDCVLAATARELGHAIVTHNLRDFERIGAVEPGLRVYAPFP